MEHIPSCTTDRGSIRRDTSSTSPEKNGDDAPSGCAGCTRLAAINAGLYAACKSALDRLDYLRKLWGDEGITGGLCETLRAAVAKAEKGGGE
jgi:hypothetical protein